jgi:hypothetical protein
MFKNLNETYKQGKQITIHAIKIKKKRRDLTET